MKINCLIICALIIVISLTKSTGQNLNPTSYISASGSINSFVGGYTFSYATSGSPWNGALMSFGGFYNTYDCQISTDYGPHGGKHMSFRTKNGDNNTWNTWNEIWHSNNLNNNNSDFNCKNLYANGNVSLGDNSDNTYNNLIIKGPNSPTNENSKRDISFEFAAAGKARIRSFRGGSWDTYLQFLTSSSGNSGGEPSVRLHINGDGNIGIGTVSPTYKLDVCGTIRAKEIKVDILGGCDFVFRNNYKLMDLNELEQFVKTNQHLPEIASEKEMIENGVNMKEMQMKLLQKMEEMTLYVIELKKENEKLKIDKEKRFEEQQEMLLEMKKRLDAL